MSLLAAHAFDARNGQGVSARFLVKAGIPVDAPDEEGHTPLHWASYCNHPQVCDVLLRLGAGALI